MASYVAWMQALVAEWGLWGIAASGFLSSTVLPGTSEVLVSGYAALHPEGTLSAFWVASLFNTLGAMTTWAIGRWLPASDRLSGSAKAMLARYGVWALLLTWVPVIGDGLSLAAGWLRTPFWVSLVLTFVGKAFRYAVLLGLVGLIFSH